MRHIILARLILSLWWIAFSLCVAAICGCGGMPEYKPNSSRFSLTADLSYGAPPNVPSVWVIRDKDTDSEYLAVHNCGVVRLDKPSAEKE
jgi:hypothetical protein